MCNQKRFVICWCAKSRAGVRPSSRLCAPSPLTPATRSLFSSRFFGNIFQIALHHVLQKHIQVLHLSSGFTDKTEISSYLLSISRIFPLGFTVYFRAHFPIHILRPSAHLGSRNYSQPDQWTRRFYRRLDPWTPRLYHRLARLLSTTLYNSSVARLLSGSCFKHFLLDIAGGRAGVRALL